jgi:hypothetical protein
VAKLSEHARVIEAQLLSTKRPGYETIDQSAISFPEPAILGKEREALG